VFMDNIRGKKMPVQAGIFRIRSSYGDVNLIE
jgi:hypothetical protein